MAGGTLGGSGEGHDDGAVLADINVTPLVDVTLVLLIIMMVTAPMIAQEAMTVQLPSGKSGVERTGAGGVSLLMTHDGTVYLSGKVVGPSEVEDAIRAAVKADPNVEASIAADKSVPYGEVAVLMDKVREMGVTRLALQIEPAGPAH